MPRGAPRKTIAMRLSADELAELERAYKRESTRHEERGHYGFRTWLRRTLLAHARQIELQLGAAARRNTPAGVSRGRS